MRGEGQYRAVYCSGCSDYSYCSAGCMVESVELGRQHSRTPCIFGRTCGFDDCGVWVSGGCRGEFDIQRRRY
ncbi:MAG: DUF3011 domain-containing protein [Nitrososphaerota archaeon]